MGILDVLYPKVCAGCGAPGAVLCEMCTDKLERIEQTRACPNCGAPYGAFLCTECKEDFGFDSCTCAVSFDRISASIITIFKDAHELRLAPIMAHEMAQSLINAQQRRFRRREEQTPCALISELDAVCFVPATAEAYDRRGFDHTELVAKDLCRELSLPLLDVLLRKKSQDQRDLGKAERQANVKGSVRVQGTVRGLTLLLIDDVLTTGASTRACVEALRASGAKAVHVLTFARVW